MSDLETLLLSEVAPRLFTLGYEYDPNLRLGDELSGFRKPLGDGVQAIIQFQRRTAADEFTINLLRVKTTDLQTRVYDGYTGSGGARLSYVLWFVHNVRLYRVPDYWWLVTSAALRDAAEKTAQYGVPWIEDQHAPTPWEMPLHHGAEFAAAVKTIVAPELERLGYQLEQRALAGKVPYLYFSKSLADGTFASIEMQSIYSLDPGEFNFDVRLQRRPDRNPLAPEKGLDHQARHASLAQLSCQARGVAALLTMTVAEAKTLLWHYADRAELDAQLLDARQQIVAIGIPWLEQQDISAK